MNSISTFFNARKLETVKGKIDKFLEKNHAEEGLEANNTILRFLRELLEREDSSKSEKIQEIEK